MNPLRWRKMSWVLNIWNAIFLIWVIVGVSDRASEDCANDPDVIGGVISKETCEAASDVGTGIGVAFIIVLWFIGFLVLSLIWLMTRPKHRQCPVCGHDVKKGQTVCRNCGYDFTTPMRPGVAGPGGAAKPAPEPEPPRVEATSVGDTRETNVRDRIAGSMGKDTQREPDDDSPAG